MENIWYYNNEEVTSELLKDYNSFVYIITNLIDGRCYIGQKLCTAAKTRQVKGKKKKFRAESDWKNYWGSSLELQADVLKYGEENFKREIIHLCKTKAVANYLELKEQIIRDALLSERYYNSFCGGKIHSKHLKSLYLS